MRTTVTIVLTTDTNTIPQADENIKTLLEGLASDAKARVTDIESGNPAGNYIIKRKEQKFK